jgi:hypothetical protein
MQGSTLPPLIDRMRSRFLLAAVVAAVLAVAGAASPSSLAAQLPASPPASPLATPSPGVTWEYGTFAHQYGAAKRWVGPDGKMIEHSKLPDFLTALGAAPAEIPEKYAAEERWNSAVLNLLGRQGWDAVGCQLMDRAGNYYYVCLLKRAVVVTKPADIR